MLWEVRQGVKPDKLVMALDDTILQITRASLSSRGTAVAQWLGDVLYIGRSLFRSQLVSLEFFIDIILPIAPWP